MWRRGITTTANLQVFRSFIFTRAQMLVVLFKPLRSICPLLPSELLRLYTGEHGLQRSVTTTPFHIGALLNTRLCWLPPPDCQSPQTPVTTVLPVVGGERCEKLKQRWRSRCSLAVSRLQVFVVALICNQDSSHIRSQLFWKGRRAPFNLRLHGASLEKMRLVVNERVNAFGNLLLYGSEKVPNEMLGYVPDTQDFSVVIIPGKSLASRTPTGKLLCL